MPLCELMLLGVNVAQRARSLTAFYATDCDVLCVLTRFYQNQHGPFFFFLQMQPQLLFYRIRQPPLTKGMSLDHSSPFFAYLYSSQ